LSAAAAILVTRISDSGDFEQQVAGQVLTSPTVIFSASGMMVALALIPGMPWFMFMTFAGVLAFVAWRLTKRVKGPDAAGMAAIEAALRDERP
ncbi:FHIPEP family type III secretion protein, partial [Salmonella enterica subsp. enterica]|nr:flagellar biosynthesis protein FlhA [Salmonella enterica]